MEKLTETEGKIYEAVAIDGTDGLGSFGTGTLFPCLIWDHDGRFTDSDRTDVARALLDSGCRYAVCGGMHCETWHDAVDAEFVERHLADSENIKDVIHVMISWHDGESPDDVVLFFVLNTNFNDHDFKRYLVLHVGTGPKREQVDAAVRKYALNSGAV